MDGSYSHHQAPVAATAAAAWPSTLVVEAVGVAEPGLLIVPGGPSPVPSPLPGSPLLPPGLGVSGGGGALDTGGGLVSPPAPGAGVDGDGVTVGAGADGVLLPTLFMALAFT